MIKTIRAVLYALATAALAALVFFLLFTNAKTMDVFFREELPKFIPVAVLLIAYHVWSARQAVDRGQVRIGKRQELSDQ
ncbi:MAG: hypothetical protein KTR24_10710 [Saprospiraceae bacterium]|nr:hypothetical protein [Saprospiraceae bacterium]